MLRRLIRPADWGRVRRYQEMLDPRNAFLGTADIQWAKTIIQQGTAAVQAQHRRAREILNATVHPDTGEAVRPFFLRLSFLVPANMTLDAGMILARTPAQTVLAQTANQVYNAAHYWANRNATNEEPNVRVLASFSAATVSSVSAALALQRVAGRSKGVMSVVLRRISPFVAVATADLLNLSIMRSNEWLRGVTIRTEDGTELGQSRRAGALAVGSCIASRVMAAAPVLLSSSFAMHAVESHTGVKGPFAWMRLPIALGVAGTAIVIAVPLTFGFFRQDARVNVSWLEPEFRHCKDTSGRLVHHVWYHKGL